MSFLKREELQTFEFKNLGKEVKISDKATFHNSKNISIGDYSRIDDFCVLSAGVGGIEIGRNVHIAIYTSLIGKGKISIGNFSNISSKVAIYSSNDDYSGEYMTNPTVDEKYTNVTHGDVIIGKHVIIGSGSILLPLINIEDGVCIGALSLVKENCKSFTVYTGVPAKAVKERSKKLLLKEKQFLSEHKS